jgi:hypothetical protein
MPTEEVSVPKLNLLILPISLMDTRDCFVFDPIVVTERVNLGPGRENVIKRRFYFDPEVLPDNYGRYLDEEKLKENPDLAKDYKMYPVGCTTYENFFTD